jgi:hypothetical protein
MDGAHRGWSRGVSYFVSMLPVIFITERDGVENIRHQAGFSISRDSSHHLRFLVGSRLCDLRMVFPRLYCDVDVSYHVLNGWTFLHRVRGTVSVI